MTRSGASLADKLREVAASKLVLERSESWAERMEEVREKGKEDFWVFCTEVMQNTGLDPYFHRIICRFVEHGESSVLPQGDYYFPTRESLVASKGCFADEFRIGDGATPLSEVLASAPVALDGSFRGMFVRIKSPQSKITLVARGHLKTTVATTYKHVWHLVRDPAETALILMNSGVNAKSVVREMQSHVEVNDRLRECYPYVVPPHLQDSSGTAKGKGNEGYRWQANLFDIPFGAGEGDRLGRRQPSVTAYGINSRLVSQHVHRRHCDDIVDEKVVSTVDQITKNIEQYRALMNLGIGEHTRDFYVGTPYDYGDVSQWLLDEKLSGVDDMSVMICTAEDANGAPMYPKGKTKGHPGFSEKVLRRRRNQLGIAGYSSQMLMQPVDVESQSFRAEWWQFYDVLPKGPKGTVLSVDPAISERKQGDYSAFVVVTIDSKGRWFVRDVQRHKGMGMPGILATIRTLYDMYQPDLVGIEAISFQKSVSWALHDQTLRDGLASMPIKEVEPSRQMSKEFRIRKIAPRVEAGMVLLPVGDKEAPWDMQNQRYCLSAGLQALISEGQRFPRAPNDDVLDALAQVAELGFHALEEWNEEYNPETTLHQEIMASFNKADEDGEGKWDSVLGTYW